MVPSSSLRSADRSRPLKIKQVKKKSKKKGKNKKKKEECLEEKK